MRVSDIISKDKIDFDEQKQHFFVKRDINLLKATYHANEVIAYWWSKARKDKLIICSYSGGVLYWAFFHDKRLEKYHAVLIARDKEKQKIMTRGVRFNVGAIGRPAKYHLEICDEEKFNKEKTKILAELL
jgi:hypothetical protein